MTAENLRAVRLAAMRSPVEAAFFALAALTDAQRAEVFEEFSRIFSRATPSKSITYRVVGQEGEP